ncbi:MAG TPA: serine/threonine-protein kinase, partial [Streptomyces sp.]
MSDEGRLIAGRYRVLDRVGRGGMATVWRARDELLARVVAVKRLHPQPQLDETDLATLYERARREARNAARVSHPNVVAVHDVVDDDEGRPVIVMEYVPSLTLAELIATDGPLEVAEAARVGRGVLAALRAAHGAGVLHRDVKPANVLLTEDGRVVLTDFGIAQAVETPGLTRTGQLVGSVDFMAPERLVGAPPGPAADLWALGATLFQAVDGRSPFLRASVTETMYAIAMEPPPEVRDAGPLTPVIRGLLAPKPEERLSAEGAERLLRGEGGAPSGAAAPAPAPAPHVAASTPVSAVTTDLQVPPPAPRRGRRSLVLAATAAVVAAALTSGAFLFTTGDDREQTTADSLPVTASHSLNTPHPSASPSPTPSESATQE